MVKSVPMVESAVTSADLRAGIEGRVQQTEENVADLEEIFHAVGETPNGRTQIPTRFSQKENR
jgi:ferritin-like metal-binding protein YciE